MKKIKIRRDELVVDTNDASLNRLRLSKITPPVSPPWTIAREKLGGEPNHFPAAKLIVVRAPAGFGKTTLLLQWHAQLQKSGVALAWFGLDEADNDPARFMFYLVATLGQIAPELAADPGVTRSLSHPSANPVQLTTLLIDHLASRTQPFVLFFDDFERITDPRVVDVVRRLAEHLPAHQQMVLASRSMPDIGFSRLRVRGWAIEFGANVLRFSEEETRRFLKEKNSIALSDSEVQMLQRGTEGWPAALHLATLSLDGRQGTTPFLSNLSSCNADITQYLAEDVLSRQPAEINDFLLQTCILSQLSAALCDSLTGRKDSALLLDQLEQANLFLTPLNPERSWYRYHALFADFLKARLQRLGTFSIAVLQRKAADWYAAQQQWISALEHALLCKDAEYAAQLMELATKEMLRTGRMDTVTRWVESLPPEVLAMHPALEIDYVWALLFQYRYDEAYARMDSLTRATATKPADFHGRHLDDLNAMRVILFSMTDRFEDAYKMGAEVLPSISGEGAFDRGIVACTMIYATIAAGRFDEIKPLLDIARKSHSRAASEVGMIHCEVLAGMAELSQGHLQMALRQFNKAIGHSAETDPDPNSQGVVAATVYLADVLYETDQLEDCEQRLLRNLSNVHESGMPDIFIQSHRSLILIARSRGDREGAFKWVNQLEQLGSQRGFPRVIASAHLLQAELALDQGSLAHAERLIDQADAAVDWQRYENWLPYANLVLTPDIVRLRLALAREAYADVIAAVAPMVDKAALAQRHHRALTLRLIWAKAIALSAGESAAAQFLADSLPAFWSEGYRRSFLDEGDVVVRLLRKLNYEAAGEPRVAVAVPTKGRLTGTDNREASSPLRLSEPFSDREIQVLRLVAQGLSNRTIAEKLFISEATVKFHLRNINLKTDAHSRTQAIAIARRHGLIE